jgi:hypothetical protein
MPYCSRKCAGQLQFQEADQFEDDLEEVFSPDPQWLTGGSGARDKANVGDPRLSDDDGAQFFRRIHLVHPRARRVCSSHI